MRTQGSGWFVGLLILGSCVAPSALLGADYGLPLEGAAAEDFLRTAEVVEFKPIPVGITKPQQVTLERDGQRLKAVFKTIDEYKSFQRFERKQAEIGFADSFKHEVAAYQLNKLLGLRLVPPTIVRTLRGERGSLQMWVEGVMTEGARIKQGLQPPHPQEWNNQMFTIRLFLQLTYDTDYNNVSNLLVDPDFRIYTIDFSRAFRLQRKLRREESLSRFSRSVLTRLRELKRSELEMTMRPWLSKQQIRGLWERRKHILDLAEERVATKGELAVLYP